MRTGTQANPEVTATTPKVDPSPVPDNTPVNPTPDNKPKEIKFYNKAQRKQAKEIQDKYKLIRNDWNEVYPQSRKAMANYYEALRNAKTPADVDRAIARVMAELNKYIPGS